MDAPLLIEARPKTGDASFAIGLIAGLLIGAAFTYILVVKPREQVGEQLALPLDYSGEDETPEQPQLLPG